MSIITTRFLEVEGCNLHLLRAGKGDRTALLLHGLGDDHTVFPQQVVRDLARDHLVIAPDLAGFGRSRPRPGFGYHLRAQATLLKALLEACEAPDPIVLIGHSMGGAVATLLAADAPERTAALVNVEGNLFTEDAFISAAAVHAAERGRFDHWWKFFPVAIKRQNRGTPAISRYLGALAITTPEAFLTTAQDLHELTRSNWLSETYLNSAVRRVYFHGDTPSAETLAFLAEHDLAIAYFPGAPHWLIEYDADNFLRRVRLFLSLKKK